MAEKVIFNAIDPVFLERIVPLMPDKIDHNSEVFGLHKYFFGFESLFESWSSKDFFEKWKILITETGVQYWA